MSNSAHQRGNVTPISRAEGWNGSFNFLRRHKIGLGLAGVALAGTGLIMHNFNKSYEHDAPTIDLKQTHRVVNVPEGGTLSGIIAEAYPETKNADVDKIREKRARVTEEVINTLNSQGEPQPELEIGELVPLPADAATGTLVKQGE